MKILIAEDDLTSRSMLAAVLKKGGHEVVETANGSEAWDELQKPDAPKLVVLDWMMPVMDGLEVVRRVRAMQAPQPPYIIMLTSKDEKADVISGLDAGADDYLSKPFDPGELQARVEVGRRMVEMQKKLDEYVNELARAKDYSDNIIKSMIDALIVVSSDRRVERVNQAVLDLSGYGEAELIGKPVKILFEGEVLFEELFNRLVKEGKARDYDMDLRTKNREEIPVSLSCSVMLDCKYQLAPQDCPDYQRKKCHCEDKVARVNIIVRDMSENKLLKELKQSYEQLEQTQAQLIQTSKLATLGEMSAGLVHEMNQPLGGISLIVQSLRRMMKKGELPQEELESGLSDADASVKRMTRIIDHVRTFARQDTLEFTQVDLNKTVDGALNLLDEQLRLHDIEVVRELTPEMLRITGEPSQLEQVWINLISNARDAVDEKEKLISSGKLPGNSYRKSITVSTIYNTESEIPSVEVRVYDNGIGMTEEQKGKTFEPFFTTKEVGKGTGLGMSISYGIIKSHEGEIKVESKEGEGTIFKVLLSVGNR